ANVAKSAFLSNMSHELRTPINAVLGMDEMILRESEDENINRYATDIRNAGKSLLSLVNDILDFSKIEAGKMEIIPVDYELSSMINDLINLVRIRIEDKDLELVLHVDSTMPHLLHGDEIRLKQVITNILTNAVKYTEKGSITMDLKYEKVNDKEIDLFVSVKDTGIGIKDEDLSKLFAAFERIEEEKNRTIEGTGLGMNITQNLLNMMGSRLEVKSVYGEGSNFFFTIRQGITSDEPIGDIEETYKKTLKEGARYRESFRAPDAEILVVDDTAMNLAVIKGLLKQTQIKIDTAESGFECLDMIRKKRYDIIFLDHRMPEMDGMETFEKMHKMTEDESMCIGIPVIALTANAVSGAREGYINAGFNDYLTKPVDGEALESLIIRYLPDDKYTLVNEEEGKNLQDDTGLPEWLLNADNLNTAAGIENCGSGSAYITALKLFYENSSVNREDIRKLYTEEDWKNYNIKVHSLKSSARLIGASGLSLLAEKLENASLEESLDKDFISDNTEKLLEMYGSYETLLLPLADKKEEDTVDDSDKPLIDTAGIRDAYDSLTELIGVADFDSCEMIIRSLQGYRMPDDTEKQRFNDIMEAAKRFDWDRVEALIGSGR
ncbi:MAG: response regulator, partial [Lachnospiraceae bacterium]|nr:response regulator [Lachnospiraceae bacterium]